LDAKLAQLQSALGIQDAVAIAKAENQVKDIVYQQGQDVGRRGTNQLHLVERYLDVLVKHTNEIPLPTALVEGTAPSALVEGVSLG
jgi:hypothetical protein